ncbi:MAG: pyridoxamine 5'-phosphate oxidase [Bacteroidetes bacterium]|nr:pyridoxamine 5'-phosphate oxidase [Bacteroidota bacterium]
MADIRTDYRLAKLDENETGSDPLMFFARWFAEAEQADVREVNAMTLATVDNNFQPHARIVLLKALDKRGFVFFSNYDSDKGHQLDVKNAAALVFFWPELERQVRIEGLVEKISEAESDEYFLSRPEGSRIGAWASPQSRPISNRAEIEKNYSKYTKQFGKNIPRPAFWGGFRVLPNRIEFWQGRSSRLHDRICFTLYNDSWSRVRLAP